jgi:hypothetical protein
VARFRREARAASKIGHPNIVDVTDSGTTADGSVYFVMEFLEGLELADVIDREGALDIGRTLNIGTQICRALAAAHNAGIVHRDLKPENVFLVVREGTTDFVKVLDFGIAKSAELEERKERLTHPGMAMGTPEYMAPEQAAGRPADPRSDIYAVGAILYEMLTGAPPYDGENFMEILTKKATLEPRPLRELRPEVSELVEKVVMRALAREPTERPQSMEGFEYELTKCLAGRGVAVAKMLGMPVDPMVAAVADPSTMAASGPIYDSGVRVNPLFSTTATRQNPLLQPGALARSGPAPEVAPTPMFEVAQPPSVGWGPAERPMAPDVGAGALSTGLSGSMPSLRESSALPAVFGFLALLLVMGGVAWWYTRQPPRGTYYGTDNASSLAPAESAKPAAASQAPPVAGAGEPEASPEQEPPAKVEKPVEKVDRTPGEKPAETRPVEKGDAALLASNLPPGSKKEAEALLAVAATHEAQRRHVVARALYDRVTRGRFDREKALMGLGRIAFENKEFPAAVDFATRAFDAGAGDAALILLGDSHFRSGNYDEAIRHYQAYLKRHKTNRLVRQKLAEAQKAAAKKKRGG